MPLSFGDQVATLNYHTRMLSDRERVDRYREAVHEVVREGDVVLDLGTGTGLLAYFACQAGASRVYAIEVGPVVALARELCTRNGFDDRVTFVPGFSYRVTLPEQADVIVSEILWNFGVGEGVIGFLEDAKARFLKPGARSVPETVELHVAPVEADAIYADIGDSPPDQHGLDLSPIRAYNRANVYMRRLDDQALLAEPAVIDRFDLADPSHKELSAAARFEITREGTLHGICGWFAAQLSPSVRLSNRPPAEKSSWQHAFFPVGEPVAVGPGDIIELSMATVTNGSVYRWLVTLRSAATDTAQVVADLTTFFGFPLDMEGIRRQDPAATPRRSPKGDALTHILASLDGGTPVERVMDDVSRQFAAVFPRRQDADDFVRDAIVSYGR
jgi:protein arginine N-methyltransferase 1